MSMSKYLNNAFWLMMKYLLIGIYAVAIFGGVVFGSGWGIE